MKLTVEQLTTVAGQLRRIDLELASLSAQGMSQVEQVKRALALSLERTGLRHRLVAGSR